jgi:hypothetical protein
MILALLDENMDEEDSSYKMDIDVDVLYVKGA